MDELTLDGKTYISSKRAAELTGYSKDYIGQMCREGKVVARQIGRNWYVLETSIREHRFGAEAVENKENTTQNTVPEVTPIANTWSAPTYASEPIPELPHFVATPISSEEPSDAIEHAAPLPQPTSIEPVEVSVETPSFTQDPRSTEDIVEEMQSAWKDWFTRKPFIAAPEHPDELLLETHAEAPILAPEPEIEVTEVPINRTYTAPPLHSYEPTSSLREEVAKEEQIPLIRSRMTGMPQNTIDSRKHSADLSHGRIIRERIVTKGIKKRPSVYLSGFFILLAALAVGTAWIGSGYADSLFSRDTLTIQPFKTILGENSFSRAQ